MRKNGRRAQASVARTLRELKEGRLRSGSGSRVTSKWQAIAVALSEARRKGAKVPRPRTQRRGPSRRGA